MKIINVYDRKSCLNPFHPGLNVRQLLNPPFFEPARRHPDSKRQRSHRLRSEAFAQARRLKAAYVPLCLVPPPDLLHDVDWMSYRRLGPSDVEKKIAFPYRYGAVSFTETLRAHASATWWEL